MTEQHEIFTLLETLFEKNELILATMSSPKTKGTISKIVIRPIEVRGEKEYQKTEFSNQQAFHANLPAEEMIKWLKANLEDYKQTFFYTQGADYHLLIGKKGQFTLLKKAPSKSSKKSLHNRQKNYFLHEGDPIPFLIHLGVMDKEGKVYYAKRDKFRQINRFLEMINDLIPHLDHSKPLHVIDFGCGKAYLTFALYHFLKIAHGYQMKMIGLDLKEEVIQNCRSISQALGYGEELQFLHKDINDYHPTEPVDLMISLHACDTATDAALEKAIRWNAKVILSVPCCQHELFSQINQESLKPLLKHGILKERLTALVTDAARVQLLEVLGYQAQIMEFIALEHTAKNLLIRAVKRSHVGKERETAWKEYLTFKESLQINPSLEARFQKL